MRFEFKSSFDRRFRKLTPQRREKARTAVESILAYLDRRASLRPGMGLKNFHGNFWEIRVDIHDRIIFELTDRVIFWVVRSFSRASGFRRKFS